MLAFVLAISKLSTLRLSNRLCHSPHHTGNLTLSTIRPSLQRVRLFRTGFVPMAPRVREKGKGTTASSARAVIVAKSGAAKTRKDDIQSDADREAMLRKGGMIRAKLEELYPDTPRGFLTHKDSYTLLVSVLLSAQSLDSIVNQVTPVLFREADTPEKMITLGEDRIRSIIKPVGLSPQKAKNIVGLSKILVEQHGSEVPADMELMEKLPGVGHKTAGVVAINAFGIAAFPVDTHIHRLACRWGCGHPKSIPKTEENLKKWFPDCDTWRDMHLRIIQFGRDYCPAMRHDMDKCPICVFAATDEARAANAASPRKFVGALTHKTPYMIREIANVPEEAVDVTKVEAVSQGRKKSVVGGGRSAGQKKSDGTVRKGEAATSEREPRSQRQAKAKAKALLREEEDDESDMDERLTAKTIKAKKGNAIRVVESGRKRKQERQQDEDYDMNGSDMMDDEGEFNNSDVVGRKGAHEDMKAVRRKRKKSKTDRGPGENGAIVESIKLRLPVRKPGMRGKRVVEASKVNVADVGIEEAVTMEESVRRKRRSRELKPE